MGLKFSRAFTLIEAVIVAGIAMTLALLCAAVFEAAIHTFAATGTRFRDGATVARLTELWLAEEDSAWAIFTPPTDVLGKANADGHEVDFFSRDANQAPSFWAYRFDAAAHELTRYTYTTPGGAVRADQTFAGVTAFGAQTMPLTALVDSTSALYEPAYANAVLKNGAVEFYGSAAPWIAGGNQITRVHLETANVSRDIHLSTQTAPTGYTVVLTYTPAPSASPSPGLAVWPPAVRFAAQGSGSLAGSAACAAQAFTDATFSAAIVSGTSDPFGAGVTVDGPNGCYDGAIAVHEASYAGAFNDFISSAEPCSNDEVIPGEWLPSRNGPTARQGFAGGSAGASVCNLSFADASASIKTAQTVAQVIQPCWAVGGTCTFTISYADAEDPGCDPDSGQTSSGFTGRGFTSIAPAGAGTWVSADNGQSYQFTRATNEAVTVSVYSQFQRWTVTPQPRGGYRCSAAVNAPLTSRFTIPAV